MKLFIGTLYTIENEFEECKSAINKQTYKNFEHFIFKGLPNKKAHDVLYCTFMERSKEFDVLVKVDADMVIEDKNLFAKIVTKFQMLDSLKDLEIAVYDFFSDQLIWGMHAYRNTVRWQRTEEALFVDACLLKPGENIHDDSELAPAAIHCKNPSPFQAFHYGVHKALKTVQPGRIKVNKVQSRAHWNIVERTRQNFLRTGDRRIGLAVLGAELALKGDIYPCHVSYSNPLLEKLFEQYESLDGSELEHEIARVSMKNFAFLPSALRRRFLVAVFKLRLLLADKVDNNYHTP